MLKLKLADHPLLSLRGPLRAAQSLSFVAILFDEMPQRHVVNSSKRSLPRFAGYPSEARPIDTSPGSHGAVFRDQLMKKIGYVSQVFHPQAFRIGQRMLYSMASAQIFLQLFKALNIKALGLDISPEIRHRY